MSQLSRIKPEGLTGSGLSGMPTKSELARHRELERHNLTMDWYNTKVQEQTLDGDVICASCSKPETKRLGNGKLRPLAIDVPRERLICQRCASKQRTEKARVLTAKLKEQREGDEPKSFQEFWNANRARLDPAELAKLQARHDEVTFLYDVICDYNRGTDGTSEQDRKDTVQDVLQEIREHGYVDCDIVRVPFYEKSELEFYDALFACDDFYFQVLYPKGQLRPTAIFAKYGFLVALPIFVENNQVRLFLCGSKVVREAKSDSVGAMCKTLGCKNLEGDKERWFCNDCAAARTARATEIMKSYPMLRHEPSQEIFDRWGRVKDFDRQEPAVPHAPAAPFKKEP